jgi:hypothetical protein
LLKTKQELIKNQGKAEWIFLNLMYW